MCVCGGGGGGGGGVLTQNESTLFYLFSLSDPYFVNSYLIPWIT